MFKGQATSATYRKPQITSFALPKDQKGRSKGGDARIQAGLRATRLIGNQTNSEEKQGIRRETIPA